MPPLELLGYVLRRYLRGVISSNRSLAGVSHRHTTIARVWHIDLASLYMLLACALRMNIYKNHTSEQVLNQRLGSGSGLVKGQVNGQQHSNQLP